MAHTPGLELARLINRMAADINNADGLVRDFMLMGASRILHNHAKDEGIEGITDMLLSNAINGAGINHNARIIRDHRDGKEPGCGMCPTCKANQEEATEEPVKGIEDFLKKLFGKNVTVVRIDLDDMEDNPTKH